ncbi:aminoglycoside phosphotransferase [Roseovarius sp. A21]|uniref:Aminoglycoside phosphotransferase n=1 Tax=Roseovarius bejariae TaxID=2576383 RepID=A0A844CXY4_9RHOB|nr:phosphotransferase [Roseovarius bejariae]MRU15500.1 aminoglycoside phosphotransferase [Roseovarius bejariae]
MPDRDSLIRDFIDQTDWQGASLAPLAGDASNRRYLRLDHPEHGSAVLMDAPREKGEDTAPFIQIAEYLTAQGLSAPRILARDTAQGFLLLEDLGDDLFARVIPRDPTCENRLYSAATDLLVHLHRAPPPTGLAAYDPPLMADLAALAFDWYAKGATGEVPSARSEFAAAMQATLEGLTAAHEVLIQRDYHAENLLWLPDRAGVARVGLLDFQDAMRGHRAYDLVSLLQDARRDVPPAVEEAMIARYVEKTGLDLVPFRADYNRLGAQRNLRIVGVFARLCIRDGKAHYVDLIPRVWGHLMRNLEDPSLADVAGLVKGDLPAPDPAILQRLKDQCATHPTP